MINKKIGILLFSCMLLSLLLSVNFILGYTIKIPVCNSTINNSNNTNSCINYTTVSAVTNAPPAMIYLGQDGNLYLTNDTSMNFSNNYNATFITYQVTNITNVTYIYSYNATNGSTINVTILQNVTANETYLRQWIASLNISSFFNYTGYNKSDADSIFASKSDLNNIQNSLGLATKIDLNSFEARLSPLLSLNVINNGTTINLTALADHVENTKGDDFNMFWKVIVIINIVLVVIVMLVLIRNIMSGQ